MWLARRGEEQLDVWAISADPAEGLNTFMLRRQCATYPASALPQDDAARSKTEVFQPCQMICMIRK